MTKLCIHLDGAEQSALIAVARSERRDPRDQAAIIIRRELERLKLLPPIPHPQETEMEARDETPSS